MLIENFFLHNSTVIGVPGKTMGCMFTPVQVEITTYEPERVGGRVMIIRFICIKVLLCYDISITIN